jgi:CBS-domain-containing membrane protein
MGVFWECLIGFSFGCIGGAAVEVLELYRLRKLPPEKIPHYYGTRIYWAATAFMIVLGGVLVVMYILSNVDMNPIIGVNIGASAPLLLASAAKNGPNIPPGSSDLE